MGKDDAKRELSNIILIKKKMYQRVKRQLQELESELERLENEEE